MFLAVMRSRSLRAAAESLGLSHPTARRRLDAFEAELGLRLFDRRPDGLHPTDEARDLMPTAEEVEHSMEALTRAADAAAPGLRGPIKVTMPDVVGTDLLMPHFVEFSRRWPQILLEIDVSYRIADLDRREADVAVRAMRHGTLPDEHLTGRKAGTAYHAVYGRGEQWIGWSTDPDPAWLLETPFPDLPRRGAIANPHVQRAACAAGMGLTRLPCFFAEPMLCRVSEPEPAFDFWVLVHPDLRRSARMKLVRDEIVAAIAHEGPRLRGESPPD
jgi:DNA-binding transcriptional LysR family regulator